jgi:hypothetical protein
MGPPLPRNPTYRPPFGVAGLSMVVTDRRTALEYACAGSQEENPFLGIQRPGLRPSGVRHRLHTHAQSSPANRKGWIGLESRLQPGSSPLRTQERTSNCWHAGGQKHPKTGLEEPGRGQSSRIVPAPGMGAVSIQGESGCTPADAKTSDSRQQDRRNFSTD